MLPTFGALGGYGSTAQAQPRLRRMGQVAGQLAGGGQQADPYATGAMAPPTGPTQAVGAPYGGSPSPYAAPPHAAMAAAPPVGAPSPYGAPTPAPAPAPA